MSAFKVSTAHIDVLVYGASLVEPMTGKEENDMGRTLERENDRSLAARYGDEVGESSYTYSRPDRKPSIVAILKAIACYEYQSCEHEGWETCFARKVCSELRASLISQLPGYNEAPWGVEAGHFGKSKEVRLC